MSDLPSGLLILWIPFLISWGVLTHYLTNTFSVRSLSVHTLVSAIFALCIDLFVLVGYEMLGVLGVYRHFTWRVVLLCLCVLLAVALPYFLLHLCLESRGLRGWGARVLATALCGAWLWGFWGVGSLFPVVSQGDHDQLSLEGAIGRLGVVGVIVVACLSGYGAVTNPYALLSRAQLGRVSEKNILVQREALRMARNRLHALQRSLADVERRQREGGGGSGSGGGGTHPNASSSSSSMPFLAWPLYALHALLGSEWTQAGGGALLGPRAALTLTAATLRRDVEQAESIETEEEESLSAMLDTRQHQHFSKTLMGRASSAMGVFLSIYCLYRIAITVYNVLLRRDPTKDPITRLLEILLVYIHVTPEFAAWLVQPVSFLFVIMLMVSSMRGLWQNIHRALGMANERRRTPSKAGSDMGGGSGSGSGGSSRGITTSNSGGGGLASSVGAATPRGGGVLPALTSAALSTRDSHARANTALVLVVAGVSGMHVIATLLLMRMSMPEEYREGITRAVGNMHFNFFHRWFDLIFLIAVMGSVVMTVFHATAHSKRVDMGLKEPSPPPTLPGSPINRGRGGANKWRPGMGDSGGGGGGDQSPGGIRLEMEE